MPAEDLYLVDLIKAAATRRKMKRIAAVAGGLAAAGAIAGGVAWQQHRHPRDPKGRFRDKPGMSGQPKAPKVQQAKGEPQDRVTTSPPKAAGSNPVDGRPVYGPSLPVSRSRTLLRRQSDLPTRRQLGSRLSPVPAPRVDRPTRAVPEPAAKPSLSKPESVDPVAGQKSAGKGKSDAEKVPTTQTPARGRKGKAQAAPMVASPKELRDLSLSTKAKEIDDHLKAEPPDPKNLKHGESLRGVEPLKARMAWERKLRTLEAERDIIQRRNVEADAREEAAARPKTSAERKREEREREEREKNAPADPEMSGYYRNMLRGASQLQATQDKQKAVAAQERARGATRKPPPFNKMAVGDPTKWKFVEATRAPDGKVTFKEKVGLPEVRERVELVDFEGRHVVLTRHGDDDWLVHGREKLPRRVNNARAEAVMDDRWGFDDSDGGSGGRRRQRDPSIVRTPGNQPSTPNRGPQRAPGIANPVQVYDSERVYRRAEEEEPEPEPEEKKPGKTGQTKTGQKKTSQKKTSQKKTSQKTPEQLAEEKRQEAADEKLIQEEREAAAARAASRKTGGAVPRPTRPRPSKPVPDPLGARWWERK